LKRFRKHRRMRKEIGETDMAAHARQVKRKARKQRKARRAKKRLVPRRSRQTSQKAPRTAKQHFAMSRESHKNPPRHGKPTRKLRAQKRRKRLSRPQRRLPKPTRHLLTGRRRKLPKPQRQGFFRPPRSEKQYLALSLKNQDLWDRIVQVPALLRSKGWFLRRASYELSVPQELVLRLARDAFRKLPSGRIVAKKRDRLLRLLPLLSHRGLVDVFLNDSRAASRIGEFWNAVALYINKGDSSAVQLFDGEGVRDINGQFHFFLTDLAELRRQASFGTLRFESIYGRTAR
jgi:hypothetical protein